MPIHAQATEPTPSAPACPLWRRLCALIYDLLLVVAIMVASVMVGLLVTGGRLLDEHQHLRAYWFPFFEAACVGGYFVASWRRGGQTLGMRPWRLRLTRDDGGTPTLQQALIRALVAAAPLILLLLEPMIGLRATLWTLLAVWAGWFAVALFDRRRRALHDIAAGTEIRRLG